jgi:hypothetical protein
MVLRPQSSGHRFTTRLSLRGWLGGTIEQLASSFRTANQQRNFNIEICYPEREPANHFEEAVREVIRFYALPLDEAVAVRGGADLIFAANR